MIQSHSPRLSWTAARRELARRLSEPAPGRVQLLTGPRASGKTTLARAVAEPFGDHAVRASGESALDESRQALDAAWRDAEALAARAGRALLVVDDVHVVKGWEAWVRGRWEATRRGGAPLHVVLTGSCALGSSHAGTGFDGVEAIPLAPWTAAAIVEAGVLPPLVAAHHVVTNGSTPPDPAQPTPSDFAEARIAGPTLLRDLPAMFGIRAPALLRGVLDACMAAATRMVSVARLRAACLDASGAAATPDLVSRYLGLLEASGLVAALPNLDPDRWIPLASTFRSVVLDNALLDLRPAAEVTPAPAPHDMATRVRNACLAHLCATGRQPWTWSDGAREVDAVLDDDRGRQLWLVRTGRVTPADLAGLLDLCARRPDYAPVLVGDEDGRPAAKAADVEWVDWKDVLVTGR